MRRFRYALARHIAPKPWRPRMGDIELRYWERRANLAMWVGYA